jgi:peptide/nickel transport system permease protein
MGFRRMRRAGMPLIPVIILFVLVFVGVFGPRLTPHSSRTGDLANSMTAPYGFEGGSSEFLLGTDFQGRDILSRLIAGARITLIILTLSTLGAGFTGSFLGLISGYFGGLVDAVIMRVVDIVLSLPGLVLALVFATAFGPRLINVIIVVILSFWVTYARQVRGDVLSIKERDYVVSARAIGASNLRIMGHHVLPNVAHTIIILATLLAGNVILLEASLSFLGVGIPAPQPAWGVMVSDGRQWVTVAPWIAAIPGVAIGLVILSLNLLGDWARDYLDPSLRNLQAGG